MTPEGNVTLEKRIREELRKHAFTLVSFCRPMPLELKIQFHDFNGVMWSLCEKAPPETPFEDED